jgi:DNA-binding IclR family transcriptional regulator
MTADNIPEVVRQLIAERIDSIPELEAILHFRQDPGLELSAEETGKRLYLSPTVAAHILSVLTERGFLAQSSQKYRYAPATTELADAVTSLAATYSRHLIEVTKLVHAKPSASVRLFAQAFRLRKDK